MERFFLIHTRIQKYKKYQNLLSLVYISFSKTFDNVHNKYGVQSWLNIIGRWHLYRDTTLASFSCRIIVLRK